MEEKKVFEMMQADYDYLYKEHEHKVGVETKSVEEAIATARAHGDLSENADYDAALNAQGKLYGEIEYLHYYLVHSKVIDIDTLDTEVVHTNNVVKASSPTRELLVRIVCAPCENIPDKPGIRRITNESPIGKALLGHKVGDKAEVILPNGKKVIYTISEISK